MVERRQHWQDVYQRKQEAELSWHEDTPALSLELLREAGLDPAMAVVDIGGGTSRLVDMLVAAGQRHVTVLDLSARALEIARERVGDVVQVEWIVADVTRWEPARRYDLWHDRAAFHFLTEQAEQRAYARVLDRALETGGRAVIGTFAPDGPEKCSGLPVARHDAASLQAVLGDRFRLVTTRRHAHATPWGAVQQFQFSTFAKISDEDSPKP